MYVVFMGVRNIINTDDFEKLVERYYKLVYKIGIDVLKNKQEAENISQETFLSLYKNIHRYSNLNETQTKNLICKIALNKCKDYIKKPEFKLITSIEENCLNKISHDYFIEEELIKKERQMLIKKAVNQLKAPYKEIIVDYYFNNLSLDEIAHKTNKSKGVIKTQLFRGRKILKIILEGGDLNE